MARSVMVVGGNGFVGSHIVRELLRRGHRVCAVGQRMPVNLLEDVSSRVSFFSADVQAPTELAEVFASTAPDTVVWAVGHNANATGLMATGETESAPALNVNAVGLFNVLNAAHQYGVRRAVLTGSTVVFGPAAFYGGGTVDESDAVRPTTVYGLSKANGEAVAQYFRDRFDMQTVTLRPTVVFGPGRWYGGVAPTLNRMFAEARPGARIEVEVPAEIIDLVYVKDVAMAMGMAVDSDARLEGAYHVNSFAARYRDLAAAISNQVHDCRIECTETASQRVYPLVHSARIRSDLGFSPAYTLDAAVADFLREIGPPSPRD